MGDKHKKSNDKYNIQWDINSLNASSSSELTGLIPSGPDSDDELESYNEILTYRPENTVAKDNEKNMNQTLHARKTTTDFKNKKGWFTHTISLEWKRFKGIFVQGEQFSVVMEYCLILLLNHWTLHKLFVLFPVHAL